MADRFDKFTERARHSLSYAHEESRRLNHDYIGTEHLLLGIVREELSVGAMIITDLGARLSDVRGAVETQVGRGEATPGEKAPLTPRAKKSIELAVAEARRLNHSYIGTEHLLVGLVREGEGIAYSVLDSLGVTLEKARAETERILSDRSAPARSESVAAAEALAAINGAMAAVEALDGEDLATELSQAVFLPVLRSISSDLNLLASSRPPAGYYVEIRRLLHNNLRLLEEAARVFERHDVEDVASPLAQAAASLRAVVG